MAQKPLNVEVEEDYRYAYEGACIEIRTLIQVCEDVVQGRLSVDQLNAFITQFKSDSVYLSDALI